jgi:putative membrane protein
MRSFALRLIINAITLLLISYLIKDFYVANFWAALVAALVLGLLNAVIRPVLLLLTLPLNIMTLGLFTFIVNGIMLKLVSLLVVGFNSGGFFITIFGALLLTVISGLLSKLIGK